MGVFATFALTFRLAVVVVSGIEVLGLAYCFLAGLASWEPMCTPEPAPTPSHTRLLIVLLILLCGPRQT